MLQQQYIQKYTQSDYQHWEDDWELINGYPYAMSPSPLPKHQIIGKNFIVLFTQALGEQKANCNCELLYECDWVINNETVVKPDMIIVCGAFNKEESLKLTPSLIVEIFSKATKMKDRNTKFNLYESYGVKYYLMADPDKKSLEYFQLIDNKYHEVEKIQSFSLDGNCKIDLILDDVFK